MDRKPEPELMDLPDEVAAYALADFAEVNQRFADRLAELAADHARADVLDVGCGPGDIPIRVSRAQPNWKIVATDASQPMLDWAAGAIARAGLSHRISLRLDDAKTLASFAEHSFDVVYSNSLLHHLTEAEQMWRAIARVTRRGGVVFFRDLYRPRDESAARAIVQQHAGGHNELAQEEFYRSLLSAYSPDEIRRQLDQAGLGGLTVQTINDRHVDVFGQL